MVIQRVARYKNFSHFARKFRKNFESRFGEPYSTRRDRFVWDFFDVPDQYAHWRCPLLDAFPGPITNGIIKELGDFGRSTLGCQHISEPWVSAYLNGNFQELHTDPKHGPFAFVLSINPKIPLFKGGETFIANETLFQHDQKPRELSNFFDHYSLSLSDLLVFDGSLPHGVTRVTGAERLLDARLVIHGWFTEPNVMLNGRVALNPAKTVIHYIGEACLSALEQHLAQNGYLAIQLSVDHSKIKLKSILASTLRDSHGALITASKVQKIISIAFSEVDLKKNRTRFTTTIPFYLESNS